jgi:hypothetical protein
VFELSAGCCQIADIVMLDTLYSNTIISENTLKNKSHNDTTTNHMRRDATLVAMLQYLAVRIRNA